VIFGEDGEVGSLGGCLPDIGDGQLKVLGERERLRV